MLAESMSAAPSFAVARHLWRRLIEAWGQASRDAGGDLSAILFAMPTVIIAAASAQGGAARLEAILSDPQRAAALMREHGALSGNRSFALSAAVVAADALDIARLPALLDVQRRALAEAAAVPDLPPTPIAVQAGHEGVHLRFVMGQAIAAPGADVLSATDTKGWGLALSRELARQLGAPGVSVLALPGAPQSPPAALVSGRAAQRAVGAQLFASNAIRRLRSESSL